MARAPRQEGPGRIDEADGSVRTYGYDDLYRLTSERVTVDGLLAYEKAFTYDDVGNRLTQTTNAVVPGLTGV